METKSTNHGVRKRCRMRNSYLSSVASRTICKAFWLTSNGTSLDHATLWFCIVTRPKVVCTETVFLSASTPITTYRAFPRSGTKTGSFTLGMYFAMPQVSHRTAANSSPVKIKRHHYLELFGEFGQLAQAQVRIAGEVVPQPAQMSSSKNNQHALIRRIDQLHDIRIDANVATKPVG